MSRTAIQTYTGRRFDLLNPRAEDVCLADIAHALARLNRYTGHIVPEHYSVAEHSVEVARRCLPGLEWAGLCHDAHEAYVGDVSSPMKQTTRAVHELSAPQWIREPFVVVEDLVQKATRKRLECLGNAEVRRMVKAIDLAMLRIERDQLMTPCADWSEEDWVSSATGEPLPTTWHSVLRCEAPIEAEGRWLLFAQKYAPTPTLRLEAAEAYGVWDSRRIGARARR